MPTSNDCANSDFEQLLNFFDRLVASKSQASLPASTNSHEEDTVTGDLAHIFKRLVPAKGLSKHRTRAVHSRAAGKEGATDSVVGVNEASEVSSIISNGKFPSGGKEYPFTFKLMIHKLYALEDWAKKVKDVLATSQKQFRPLAEREADQQGEIVADARCQQGKNARPSVVTGRKLLTIRTRSQSNAGYMKRKEGPLLKTPTSPGRCVSPLSLVKKESGLQDNVRAVKKRCVERRKSLEALPNHTEGKTASWVYDAAASSLEATDTISRRHMLAGSGAEVLQRARYGDLEGPGNMPRVEKRRVSSACEWKSWSAKQNEPPISQA